MNMNKGQEPTCPQASPTINCPTRINSHWVVDFEFSAPPGERQEPVCVVAHCLETGETVRQWLQGGAPETSPYPTGPDTVLIAFYASAEWRCHLNLGWDLPENTIDLYVEARTHFNGRPGAHGYRSLLAVCGYYGIKTIDTAEKDRTRDLIIAGGPFSAAEKGSILEYCESDVLETAELYKAIMGKRQLYQYEQALFRGQYMVACALMEWRGVPIDTDSLNRLKRNWDKIKLRLIEQVDQKYGFYEGTTFKMARFQEYIIDRCIRWPGTTPTGKPGLDDDTLKDACKAYPDLQDLRDLRYIMGQLRLTDLAVGGDGRNRQMLSPFSTKTGRNAPSNSRFIFGPAVWFRSLIKPAEGRALAYIDYSQQEFGIAAALSGDKNMQEAYSAGDPYLHFAKMAGAVPESATKATHGEVRAAFKACILGAQYGMQHESLAKQANISDDHAQMLLKSHKRVFPAYWEYVDHKIDQKGRLLTTKWGWEWDTTTARPPTIQNWPIQATGAEILRAACVRLMEAGIEIIAPVHDAVLIEADIDRIESEALRAQKIMEDVTEDVLGAGHRIHTDIEYIKYPDRYQDERGGETWDRIMRILQEVENEPEPQRTLSTYSVEESATG